MKELNGIGKREKEKERVLGTMKKGDSKKMKELAGSTGCWGF